jgi:predicted metalloendopeptidase
MIAHEQLKFLSNKFLKVRNIDRIKALKTTKFVQRWEFCVARVFNYMTHALMALHHQTYIKIELKTDVLKFVDEIFKNWEIAMKKFPELSEETRKSFFKRIRNYKIVVGCANEILDKNNLENFYKGWKTNETEFFELSTHLNTEYRKQKFRRLSKDFVDLTQYSKNVGFSRLNYFENFSVIDGTLCKLMYQKFDENLTFIFS